MPHFKNKGKIKMNIHICLFLQKRNTNMNQKQMQMVTKKVDENEIERIRKRVISTELFFVLFFF